MSHALGSQFTSWSPVCAAVKQRWKVLPRAAMGMNSPSVGLASLWRSSTHGNVVAIAPNCCWTEGRVVSKLTKPWTRLWEKILFNEQRRKKKLKTHARRG